MTEPPSSPVGSSLSRWRPDSVADVQRAIDEGDLVERQWVDVKVAQKFTDAAKKELARDLASFANDGGYLIFGVAEDKQLGTMSIEEVELAGLAERFGQIARDRLDPPLYVICHPLVGDDPGRGVMVVEVPASPFAPHQGPDGVYFGRADKMRTRLTDGEIARLHMLRESRVASADQLLSDARRMDPWPHGSHAHCFVVLKPLTSRPDLLSTSVDNPISLLVPTRKVLSETPGAGAVGVNNDALGSVRPVPDGVVLMSYSYEHADDQTEPVVDPEGTALALKVNEDGTVTVYSGGASRKAWEQRADPSASEWLVAGRILVWVEVAVRAAMELATPAGYLGMWAVAVQVTNLGGMADRVTAERLRLQMWPRSDDPYVESTTCSTDEALQQPQEIVRRLTRRLLRGLSATQVYEHQLVRPASPNM